MGCRPLRSWQALLTCTRSSGCATAPRRAGGAGWSALVLDMSRPVAASAVRASASCRDGAWPPAQRGRHHAQRRRAAVGSVSSQVRQRKAATRTCASANGTAQCAAAVHVLAGFGCSDRHACQRGRRVLVLAGGGRQPEPVVVRPPTGPLARLPCDVAVSEQQGWVAGEQRHPLAGGLWRGLPLRITAQAVDPNKPIQVGRAHAR